MGHGNQHEGEIDPHLNGSWMRLVFGVVRESTESGPSGSRMADLKGT
jgi:hypothetical protein